jgi:hypothetical protein
LKTLIRTILVGNIKPPHPRPLSHYGVSRPDT